MTDHGYVGVSEQENVGRCELPLPTYEEAIAVQNHHLRSTKQHERHSSNTKLIITGLLGLTFFIILVTTVIFFRHKTICENQILKYKDICLAEKSYLQERIDDLSNNYELYKCQNSYRKAENEKNQLKEKVEDLKSQLKILKKEKESWTLSRVPTTNRNFSFTEIPNTVNNDNMKLSMSATTLQPQKQKKSKEKQLNELQNQGMFVSFDEYLKRFMDIMNSPD